MPKLDDLLRRLHAAGGSDLHLAAGLAPRMRCDGELRAVDDVPVLGDAELRALLREIAADRHWDQYARSADVDFAYGLPGVARFRANYFVQENGAAAVFRIIPEKIVSLDALALPAAIEGLARLEQGLVLVTGPTGSGKSTTLAAILDRVNRTLARHVVTIEDPVEFVHSGAQCVFSHREVGRHTQSFGAALRAAIRQDADVVLVGEMRDLETISLALKAAEMGMLVFGTLHTNSAAKTIDRLIDVFPADEQPQARLSLADSLAAIVAQLLLPRASGDGRVAVHEILLKTPALPNLIRESSISMLVNLMQSGRGEGMQLLDDALLDLVARKVVSPRDAYLKAQEKGRFEALIEKE